MNVRRGTIAHTDERGTIQDIVQDGEFQHATLITSRCGARRGDHYHLRTVQHVHLISGTLKALARDTDGQVKSAILLPGDAVINEAGEHHALVALEDSTFLVLTNGPRGGDGYESDTYRLTHPL